MTVTTFDAKDASTPKIWWSNAFFFTGIHVAAVAGAYYLPPTSVAWQSLVLAFLVWQLADFGYVLSMRGSTRPSLSYDDNNHTASPSDTTACIPIERSVQVLAFVSLLRCWVLQGSRVPLKYVPASYLGFVALTRMLIYSVVVRMQMFSP